MSYLFEIGRETRAHAPGQAVAAFIVANIEPGSRVTLFHAREKTRFEIDIAFQLHYYRPKNP